VRAIVADGATANRKFFKLHNSTNMPLIHCAEHPLRDQLVFFICDVPHLIKTTRNCWENSGWHSKTRNLMVSTISLIDTEMHDSLTQKYQISTIILLFIVKPVLPLLQYNNKPILWTHLVNLVKEHNPQLQLSSTSDALYIGNLKPTFKIKPSHIFLTPALRMKVKLAAQVRIALIC
jgi:hypothetical protein